jgi:hypothetical protein
MAKKGCLIRDVTIAECPWLPERNLAKDCVVFLDENNTIPWLRVSLKYGVGPFFAIPKNTVRWYT